MVIAVLKSKMYKIVHHGMRQLGSTSSKAAQTAQLSSRGGRCDRNENDNKCDADYNDVDYATATTTSLFLYISRSEC